MRFAILFGCLGALGAIPACSGGGTHQNNTQSSGGNAGAPNAGDSNAGGAADIGGSPNDGGSTSAGGTAGTAGAIAAGGPKPITAAGFQTCAMQSSGSVQCWGNN